MRVHHGTRYVPIASTYQFQGHLRKLRHPVHLLGNFVWDRQQVASGGVGDGRFGTSADGLRWAAALPRDGEMIEGSGALFFLIQSGCMHAPPGTMVRKVYRVTGNDWGSWGLAEWGLCLYFIFVWDKVVEKKKKRGALPRVKT